MRYAIEQPVSLFAEAIRNVRFALQRAARTRPTQVVMVTSAIDGEGKTTLAVNLALSLAVLGVRTVLVEGDLRNPEMTRSLCPCARTGLVNAALGEIPLHQAVLVEPSTKLAVLPSPPPQDAALLTEFVSSEGMTTVLKALRQHFDVVIIDSPPLLPLVDGRALAEHADSVILAVGWDRTSQDVFLRAVDLLAPVYDRILGAVMTQVDLSRLRFYEAYNGAAYNSAYLYELRAKEAAE